MAALLIGGVYAPSAAAQGNGVFFNDPTSPGGQEYALPLERARREGQDKNREGSRKPAPRFGTGVAPSGGSDDSDSSSGAAGSTGSGGSGGSAGDSSGGGDGAGGSSRGEGGGPDAESGSGDQSLEAVARAAARGSGSGGVSPELGLSGLAVGVVLAGILLGIVIRRLRRQQGA